MNHFSLGGQSPEKTHALRPAKDPFGDAVRYWEPRRIGYNLALVLQVCAWVVLSWPHFRPAFTFPSLGKLLVLAALANICYCTAYLVDLPFQQSTYRDIWLRRRGILWWAGTLFATLVACYWIGDEIYPFVS
ncbi:MAG: hypothetical protein NVS4B3_19100 [Gemmatimonadaceae bacterium]